MNPQLTIPHLPDPLRYTGTYAIHFPHGVAVGYLAEEVAIILSIDEHRDAPVYRVHRVDPSGSVELIGVRAADIAGEDVLLFANTEAIAAGEQFAELRKLANGQPLPCPVRVEMIDLPELPAPHAVCLIYPRHANTMVSDWLLAVGFGGGDQVFAGRDAANARHGAPGSPIGTMMLATKLDRQPRTREEILATIDKPLQR